MRNDEAFVVQRYQVVCVGQILTEHDVKFLDRGYVFSASKFNELNTKAGQKYSHKFTITVQPKYVLIMFSKKVEYNMHGHMLVPDEFFNYTCI